MKRAITADDLDKKRKEAIKTHKGLTTKGFDNTTGKAFNPNFKTLQDIKDLLQKPENRWGNYMGVVTTDKKRQKDERTQFECYFCGWLEYYDEIVRNRCADHTIWFDWEGTNCTVYLYPRPRRRKDAKSSLPEASLGDPTNPKVPPPPY